jgi:chaperonin GroES
MFINPLGNKILVKPIKEEEKTKAGIYIPSDSTQKPKQGIVVSVGAGTHNAAGILIPNFVKSGDKVIYSKFTGVEIVDDDENTLLIIQNMDILAIIEE